MRDAEPAEFPSTQLPRVEPQRPEVWIRIGGRWREGWIVKWVRLPSGKWVVWASWDAGRTSSERAWLLFSPETIRRRDGGEPPPSD